MASACEFPDELITRPLGYVALAGLDSQNNAMHRSIWDTFTVNRRQEKVLNIQLIPGDAEFPRKKPKQRSSYEFYIPKGIFKTNWMKKHMSGLPALVVVFYDLDWNDPQWKEKQTECASRVAVIRSSLYGRNSKIAVVLIQKNMPLPPGEDPQAVHRAESLCQACELPSKSLFVLPFSDHLHGYVTRLEGAFYEIAQAYYTAEAKYVKQHKELLNKSQHQLLYVRHQFKIGFYNELKQDPNAALKHYKQSYQYLLEHRLTDINNLEIKLCAGFLNYKICKISFQLTAPLDAIGQFRKHMDYFKQKSGPSELLFEHFAWVAKQFHLFGELFQEAIKNGLQAIQTQHPGFYYQSAANATMTRREYCKKICQFSEAVNSDVLSGHLEFYGQRPWRPGCQANEAPDPGLEQAGILCLQAQELAVEHFLVIIPLLSNAVGQFREFKCGRMKRSCMTQMGEEYFKAKDYTKALNFLNRVAPYYRAERWFELLSSLLVTALRCAYLTASAQDYITFSLELLGEHSSISNDEKTRIQMNLMRVANNTIPEPEPGCDEESIIQAKQSWSELLQQTNENTVIYTIDVTSLAGFVQCKTSLEADNFHLNEMASIKVYLQACSMYPIRFSELGVKFNNTLYDERCVKQDKTDHATDENSDLYLEPKKVKIQEFKFILSPDDVEQKLEVKQLYLRLGDSIVLSWTGSGLDANISPSFDSTNYGGGRLPIKTSTDGNILWDSIHISPITDILPRDSLISMSVHHDAPALVDEYYPLTVTITNTESDKINNTRLKITETLTTEKTLPSLYKDTAEDENAVSVIEVDLKTMETGQTEKSTIYLKANEMGQRTIEFQVTYNMSVSVGEEMVNCSCSKNESVEVNIQIPFSISVKIASLKFQQIDKVHVGETFTAITYIKSTSPWPIDITSSEMVLTKNFQEANGNLTSQIAGLELQENDIASECSCLLAPLDTHRSLMNLPHKTLQMGRYLVNWKRRSSKKVVTTKVNLPNVNVEFIPFFVEATIPPYGRMQECMLCHYTVYNHTNRVLEVEVVVKASGAFMLAGSSQVQLRILPHKKHSLSYNMYPLVCGEVLLPQFHVNLPQYQQLNSDAITQKMLPTHAFVKPHATHRKEPLTPQDIQVK
ncbi:trafficking protein particle complex subunit 11-like [Clytia hemisphaerica]|uniref:Trafficking protein particle complex subunit 11 n=1 Tax=Clytia hemisphaerica TaxID=252671 RepID=A0A7M5V3T9_9CNID|eukprot:TCONS_00048164-protein